MTSDALEINLIDRLLAEQRSLTAVQRFAQKHERADFPTQEKYYRDLIPLTKPAAGQQYAFEVNLDKCTGCKACVSACHSLNGLEENETWRDVGTLYGREKAYQQTVTTACHHCAEPGCLEGCPVAAYEKDADTGIVRHLDDQCIGCQYCTMKCPYGVPKYSERLGIVRKCDMCHSRLAVGEAPACVQACPHEAIVIRVVDIAEVSAAAAPGSQMLPGAFDSSYTKPTTSYLSRRSLPEDARPADAPALHLEHAHWPLIIMLVLTQMAVGVFLAACALPRETFVLTALGFGLLNVGLIAAVFHLGRPLGAWRFFLGLRTSWMSREILAFSLLPGAALAAMGEAWFFPGTQFASAAAGATGLAAIFTSVMIYADTHRSFWKLSLTLPKFYGTALLAGAATVAIFSPAGAMVAGTLCAVLSIWELRNFRRSLHHPGDENHVSSFLIESLLPVTTRARVALTIVSLSCWLLVSLTPDAIGLAPLALASMVVSQFLERLTFFRAVVAPRMPGGL